MTNPTHLARPSLRKIAPLTYANIILFIWLNLVIAYSLFAGRPNGTLIIVEGIFNSYFWMGVFIFLSVAHAYGVFRNDWKFLRIALALGLFVKLLVAYSLIVLGVKTGISHVAGILGLWVSVAWVQFFTLKYFNKPKVLNGSK